MMWLTAVLQDVDVAPMRRSVFHDLLWACMLWEFSPVNKGSSESADFIDFTLVLVLNLMLARWKNRSWDGDFLMSEDTVEQSF